MSHRHAGRALAAIILLAVAAVASAGPAGASTKTITEFTFRSANNQPGDMVVGRDDNIWLVDQATDKIGHITRKGVITGFVIPTAASNPVGITMGPDGAVWFTEAAGNKIGRLIPGPAWQQFGTGTANASPRGITAGPDGNLYFVEYTPHTVNKINPTTHVVSTVATLPAGAGPTRIAAGPDGNLWVSETKLNKVARVTPGGTVTQVPLTGAAAPSRITGGPDGNIWVTEPGTNHVAQITTAATPVVTEFLVNGKPTGIAPAADGNLWVTLQSADAIARLSTSGVVKSFPVPTKAAAPGGIVAGGDGNIWFSENAANKIGQLRDVSGHSSYVAVQDGAYTPSSQGVPLVSGTTAKPTTLRWLFVGGKSHSVTDSSGLGLFDSGAQGPGSVFTHTFTTAGRFQYHSTVGGDTQTGMINVTPTATKASGTNVVITVATLVPGGVTMDVQVETPGSSSFVPAGSTSSTTLTYNANSGAGTYKFQVRTTSGGNSSGWSPTVRVAE